MDVAMEESQTSVEITLSTNEDEYAKPKTITKATTLITIPNTMENNVNMEDEELNNIVPTAIETIVGKEQQMCSIAMETTTVAAVVTTTTITTTKTSLKRCLSVPNIGGGGTSSMTLRSAATTATMHKCTSSNNNNKSNNNNINKNNSKEVAGNLLQETPKKYTHHYNHQNDATTATINNIHIHIPRSNPSSREVSPAPMFNIFAPRARRYSASFSPLGALAANGNATASAAGTSSGGGGGGCGTAPPLYLTPRVSQLRQEECTDVNTREVNHEREVHSAMQMSQSWEDLTLVAENWSCKSDELSNPLQVALPAGLVSCSSPSPTSNRAGLRLPYGLSPSPTRRTFATRRSMSPIAMRPSQLGPVKRKFDLEEQNSSSGNWSVYSPPPLKKIFTESRGTSPICQSPSSVCPSPDSGTYDGRITPKLFISKLCTSNGNNNLTANTNNNNNNNSNNNSNSNSSTCSSPSSSSGVSSLSNLSQGNAHNKSSALSSCSAAAISRTSQPINNIEPMCIVGNQQVDEGISINDLTVTTNNSVSGEIQDDGTMMDDIKSETSSIGGCSSISLESSSSNSFLNKFNSDTELSGVTSGLVPKHFFINKLGGLSGAKKYIVNHDHSDHSNMSNVSSTTVSLVGSELLETANTPIILVDNKI